ncbi:hypothetical protein ZOSMA_251G00030 [Zostera marina]|uniref:DUF3456 domain-containing protein n=1 Tax=Zostera marina TaxID=29655 RepID=A0A0K9PI53_ZOSMR|nr:hypothetical protein ZOSMA_251G00030 [Zostera marina]
MTRRIATSVIWIFVVCMVSSTFVSSIQDKCRACIAIAEEIELGLSNEKPRNHLDMRYRLDSKGQREGKVIDYRVSELRAYELLDGLCEKMQDYTLMMMGSGKKEWSKVDEWDTLEIEDKQESRAQSKHLSSFCARLLDEIEDDLVEKIKRGHVTSGLVSNVLCEELTKHCDSSRRSRASHNTLDDQSDEL